MKKTTSIALFLTLSAASCRQADNWIDGKDDLQMRDTLVNNKPFRKYQGDYYLIKDGKISPDSQEGAYIEDISRPDFMPTPRIIKILDTPLVPIAFITFLLLGIDFKAIRKGFGSSIHDYEGTGG